MLTGCEPVTVRVLDRRDGGLETQTPDVVVPEPIVVVQPLPHGKEEDAEEDDGLGSNDGVGEDDW